LGIFIAALARFLETFSTVPTTCDLMLAKIDWATIWATFSQIIRNRFLKYLAKKWRFFLEVLPVFAKKDYNIVFFK
jgi:hypothetical protein